MNLEIIEAANLDLRQMLINLERMKKEISEPLKSNQTEKKLKERIDFYFETTLADILTTRDFLIELEEILKTTPQHLLTLELENLIELSNEDFEEN